MDGVIEKGGHWQKGSKVHVLTVRDGRRGGFCQMVAREGCWKFGWRDAT